MNIRIKYASLEDKVAEVIGLGLNDSHDEVPPQELVEASGDATPLTEGGEMAVDTTAGPASDTIGGVTRPVLSIGAKSGISKLGSGKLDGSSGTGSSAGRGSGDSALHSDDSSAGSWMNVTVLISQALDYPSEGPTRPRIIHPDLLRIPSQLEPRRRPMALVVNMAHRLEAKPRI